jgi:predicted acetyltransferase
MADADEVQLDLVAPNDAEVLSNLLQFYIYDLSDVFLNVELVANGRFVYEKLPLFFADTARRFPFFIRYGDQVVGFALVSRGSPVSDDPDVLDVTDFFVMRRWRRLGVARRAVRLLWARFPGRWFVRVSEKNSSAIPFWADVITEYTGLDALQLDYPHSPDAWRVFCFDAPARSSEGRGRAASSGD